MVQGKRWQGRVKKFKVLFMPGMHMHAAACDCVVLVWLITSIWDGPQGGIDQGDAIGAYFRYFIGIFGGFWLIFA